ncbi:rCG33111 [Rattus norvegicus]|uniref:RCG33111 n=1 Tax=Rattus norvegicus TaxID=10116 RepID=A6HLH2_RAT|nr:rCG33111 [Rattus norvegicus]
MFGQCVSAGCFVFRGADSAASSSLQVSMPTQTEIYGTDPEWVFFGFVCLCDFRFSSLGYSFTVHQADWLSIPRDAPAYPPPPPQNRNHRLVSPRGNLFAVLKM